MPGAIDPFSFRGMARSIPKRIAMTGPPMIGKSVPKIQAGMAMIRHSKMPRPLVVRNFIAILSLSGEYRVEAIVNNGVPKETSSHAAGTVLHWLGKYLLQFGCQK